LNKAQDTSHGNPKISASILQPVLAKYALTDPIFIFVDGVCLTPQELFSPLSLYSVRDNKKIVNSSFIHKKIF
jgi:hypothetical protein